MAHADTLSIRLGLARERGAYLRGHADGIVIGRQAEAAERDAAWNRIARDAVRLCLSPGHSELEIRRWGPGGRARFGEPRPGDFPGTNSYATTKTAGAWPHQSGPRLTQTRWTVSLAR